MDDAEYLKSKGWRPCGWFPGRWEHELAFNYPLEEFRAARLQRAWDALAMQKREETKP